MEEIDRIRDRLDEALEENRQLRHELGIIEAASNYEISRALGVSPSGLKILALLSRRTMVGRSSIEMVLWPDGEYPETMRETIAVHLSRLRKALRPLGLQIENIRGEGWRLSEGSLALSDLISERLRG